MTSFAFVSQNSFLRAPPLAAGHRFGIAGLPWDGPFGAVKPFDAPS